MFDFSQSGIPPNTVRGDQCVSSSVSTNLRQFEAMLEIKKVGLMFTLNLFLDPIFEEGRQAMEEYRRSDESLR